MKIRAFLFSILVLTLLSTCQTPHSDTEVVGIWEGKNSQGKTVSIEFAADGHYRLSVDGMQLVEDDRHSNCLKYRVTGTDDSLQIDLFGQAAREVLCRLQAKFPARDQLELQLFTLSDPAERCDDIRLKRL